MKIIITESQAALIRRLSELDHYLDVAIKEINDEILGNLWYIKELHWENKKRAEYNSSPDIMIDEGY